MILFTKMNQKNIELAARPVEFGVGGARLFLGSVVHQEVIQRLLDGKERPVKAVFAVFLGVNQVAVALFPAICKSCFQVFAATGISTAPAAGQYRAEEV